MRIHLGDRQERLDVSRAGIGRIVRAAFTGRQRQPAAEYDEISLVLVDDPTIRRLNATFRSKDRVTDVLAFDLRGGPAIDEAVPRTGEVVISTDRALKQAVRYEVSIAQELARLTIHGLLHLQGYDHHHAAERRVMRQEEERILARVDEELQLLVRRVVPEGDGARRTRRTGGG